MLTDEQIMLKVSEGDIGLLSTLFDRYNIKIFNYFLRCTYNKSLSQDLTQIVFEKLIKYRESYKQDYTFQAWLYRVAGNIKNDHYRKEKSYKSRNHIYFDQTEQVYDPNNTIEKKESIKLLHAALKKLPADQREVIWMTKFEKMKYADVAKILELSESAIKVKVHRAIKRLRTEYIQLEKS